jgi:predicted phosphodiesterase
MILGLISDIHANLNSLKMALDILAGQKVDKILCAGDLVEKGPDGDAVVQLLLERDIPCVLGNHDEAAPSNQQWLREKCDLNHPNVRTRLLNETTIVYLETLPFSLRFSFENKRILLVQRLPTNSRHFGGGLPHY